MRYSIDMVTMNKIQREPPFALFKYRGLDCCILRNMLFGNLNGYVSVGEDHPLYGKDWKDKIVVDDLSEVKYNGNIIGYFLADSIEADANIINLSIYLNAHGGVNFARNYIMGLDDSILGKRWWFGFDTAHAGDLMPFELDMPGFPVGRRHGVYRDFEYVENEVMNLADQLVAFLPQKPLFDTQRFIDRLEELRVKMCI